MRSRRLRRIRASGRASTCRETRPTLEVMSATLSISPFRESLLTRIDDHLYVLRLRRMGISSWPVPKGRTNRTLGYLSAIAHFERRCSPAPESRLGTISSTPKNGQVLRATTPNSRGGLRRCRIRRSQATSTTPEARVLLQILRNTRKAPLRSAGRLPLPHGSQERTERSRCRIRQYRAV